MSKNRLNNKLGGQEIIQLWLYGQEIMKFYRVFNNGVGVP